MSEPHETRIGRLARRTRTALARPDVAVARLWQLARGEFNESEGMGSAESLLSVYAERARALGIDDLVLFLSFDCDTDLDPEASVEVMRLLDGLGIKATFAVPGTQLEHGAATYRKISEAGSQFINHGHLPHAEWRDDRYVGITFYETMSFADVEADIRKGHDTVTRVIGSAPLGFRAPHFGHFQKPEQLALVHRVALDLGYLYCSTTVPAYGFIHGPAHIVGGVVELPTFGSLHAPTSILDSWSYLEDRRNYALSETYGDLLIDTVDRLRAARLPALLTWYVDPCHVAGQAPFERAMRRLSALGVPSLSGKEAAALARGAGA